ncbi:hypothetical protein [Candidatus Nitronereus thalassa]|uniref:Uncharacterized protein n=1 Tax=Candidatus Nitronereus thalassa TaxID=3020898 RepID=A0ABU3K3D1_9BACT|nr:hypothetical protein [Candidatus Nitronereus thalassa]MDT7040869.1 hypothetical protein [Candidatus Nitronereus thalassa]
MANHTDEHKAAAQQAEADKKAAEDKAAEDKAAAQKAAVTPPVGPTPDAKPPIPLSRAVKGFEYQDHKEVPARDDQGQVIKRGDQTVMKRMPMMRPLEEGDLMSWNVVGDVLILCTRDGRKHRVSLNGSR